MPDAPAPPVDIAIAMLARHPSAAGKTRLTGALDPVRARALREALLLDALDAVLATGWPVHVFLDPPGAAVVSGDVTTASPSIEWHAQGRGDLGARMVDAVARTLGAGHDAVVLVGSDTPDVPIDALRAAGRLLTDPAGADPVFGPTEDGGFYLVGTRDVGRLAAAFAGVTWSRPTVLDQVRARLAAAGGRSTLVARWRDIDTRADLAGLVAAPGAGARRTRAVASTLLAAMPDAPAVRDGHGEPR